jgi:O-antigen/teichoic acid export membrane protein
MHSAPKMLFLLVLNQVFVSFIMFFRSNLTALQFFKSDSLVSILDRGLLIILGGILLYTNIANQQFEIAWFVYIQTIAYGFTMLLSFFILRNHIGKLKWSFKPSFVLVITRRSLPYAMYMLMGMLYNRMDGLMLDNLLVDGEFQAGVYAQGFRYYEAAGMFAILFPVILLPLFSRMLKAKEDIKSLMQISVRLLLGGGILLAVFFWFWSGQVLNWIYDDVPNESILSFRLLMIGFVGLCMFYTYGTLLTANASLKILNIISFIGLAVNIVLNFILIPIYGVVGAAFATMCTQLFAGGVQMVIASRKFQLGIDKMMVAQVITFVGIYGGFNYWLIGSYEETTKFALISIAVGAASYILVSGLLHPRRIIDRFQTKE